jgi:hypothetical protein
MPPRLVLSLLAAGALASIPSCSSDPEPAPDSVLPPENPTALGDTPIPEDFTFQSTRPVNLELSALGGGGEVEGAPPRRLRIEVRSADYGLMYRGSLLAGETFRFDFPMPPDVTQVEVTTVDEGGLEAHQSVAVDASQPSLALVVGGGE